MQSSSRPILIAAILAVLVFYLTLTAGQAGTDQRKIVVFGDSLLWGMLQPDTEGKTDNYFTPVIQKLPDAAKIIVLKRARSGNPLLNDGSNFYGLARFKLEVPDDPVVTHMIVLIGINDLLLPGTKINPNAPPVTAQQIIEGYQKLIEMAHARGIKIIGGTLMPFEGAYTDSDLVQKKPGYFYKNKERERQTINIWIRNSKAFDGVVDFDAVMRDPENPAQLLPALDGGDHLHPNAAGYRIMATAISPGMLEIKTQVDKK